MNLSSLRSTASGASKKPKQERIVEWAANLTDSYHTLDYDDKFLRELPEDAFSEARLRTRVLSAADNYLEFLSPAVASLRMLHSLRLPRNELACLPMEIGELVLLQVLNVSNNLLNAIPDSVTQLLNLTSIVADHNRLSALPDLSCLHRLGQLSVSHNSLTALPFTNAEHLLSLGRVAASHNMIASVSMASLAPNLTDLDLSRNNLTALPVELVKLSALQSLVLSHNKLVMFPEEDVASLLSLRRLDVSHNALIQLPHTLSEIPTLERVDVSNNPLAELPEMSMLPRLSYLNFNNTRLNAVPEEIHGSESLETVVWYDMERERRLQGRARAGQRDAADDSDSDDGPPAPRR